jgi:hypothetical protein
MKVENMKFRVMFVTNRDGVTEDTEIGNNLSHADAEKLQADTVAKNRKEAEKLLAERQELEEGPDSAEKRGKIKAVENKLAKLAYPTKNSTFAIRRDYESEANPPKAGK